MLSKQKIKKIRELLDAKISEAEIQKKYQISQSTLRRIKKIPEEKFSIYLKTRNRKPKIKNISKPKIDSLQTEIENYLNSFGIKGSSLIAELLSGSFDEISWKEIFSQGGIPIRIQKLLFLRYFQQSLDLAEPKKEIKTELDELNKIVTIIKTIQGLQPTNDGFSRQLLEAKISETNTIGKMELMHAELENFKKVFEMKREIEDLKSGKKINLSELTDKLLSTIEKGIEKIPIHAPPEKSVIEFPMPESPADKLVQTSEETLPAENNENSKGKKFPFD